MNWTLVLTAGLPEHSLLVGILTLVALEIYGRKPKAALWVSLAAVYTACAAAIGLSLEGYTAAPFPGQLSVAPPAFLAKAILMGLAIPVLLISREDFHDRQFHILQPVVERLAVESWFDRRQELHTHHAGIAAERTPRPEQP